MTYKEETIQIAQERAESIKDQFIREAERLLNSGAVDSESHSKGM